MSTQREQRKAQMAAAATRRAEPDARPPGRTAIRSKPVRITLDLSPELYRQLTEWAAAAATTLDVPRVPLADAVRAMIRVTAESPDQALELLRRDREQRSRQL
jgi:predicted RNA-binding Zn ribbon-like protein